MATLQTPSINQILPFDPMNDYIVDFIYVGNQIYSNRAIITDNETGEVVYDNTLDTMKLEHNIEANSLIAGKQYTIQIQVFDIDNNSSLLSQPVLFYCFSKPQFQFNNITEDLIYRNAEIVLELVYSQAESEQIRSYQFMQYSFDRTLINSSDVIYSSKVSNHTFYNLDNNYTYYFRAIGETVNGIVVDTGYIKVNIVYKTLPANLAFEVKNEYCDGYITLTSGIKTVNYEFRNDNYSLEDGSLTLTDNSLTYKDGYSISENESFSLFVETTQLPLGKFLSTNDNNFVLSVVKVCDAYYCKLTVKDVELSLYEKMPKSVVSTDYIKTASGKIIELIDISSDENETLVIEVKRDKSLYNLSIYYK